MDVTAVFGVDQHLTVAQECARALLVFAYGLAAVRLAGRRVFGKWSALDIIVSIVIGSNLSRTLTGNAPLAGTLAASTAILLLHWLLAQATARWQGASRLLEGEANDLIRDGRILERQRRRHGVSLADLDEALRQRGLNGVAEASRVTIEPSGTLTVLKR